jgi:hypothetical protein
LSDVIGTDLAATATDLLAIRTDLCAITTNLPDNSRLPFSDET